MSDHRHINEFFRLDCAPDLLRLRLFPNSKEITESMAAYHAVRWQLLDKCQLRYNDSTVGLFSVGDGATPRTAALFALRSCWICHSIDPNLDRKFRDIQRLCLYRDRVENLRITLEHFSQIVIVLVHSHAKMVDTLRALPHPRRHVVSIPCCVPHEIDGQPYVGYEDQSIWSPKNSVKVWSNV